jgi:hypothetical protein
LEQRNLTTAMDALACFELAIVAEGGTAAAASPAPRIAVDIERGMGATSNLMLRKTCVDHTTYWECTTPLDHPSTDTLGS